MPERPARTEPRRARLPDGPLSEPVAGDFFTEDDAPRRQSGARDLTERRDVEGRTVGDEPLPRSLEAGGAGEPWERWRRILGDFVDDPRRAVSEADELVGELIAVLVAQLQREKGELERRWSHVDAVSTEDLRLCLQCYRDLFDRLLPLGRRERGARSG